ncbi:tetratricopeptide repeat protein [Aliamphritea hakodatensis]|uniref:tetratricopeptide repeat protein n=1 Tax=Aliamphritea hakodatensis TaxID=2895352 RepID=UPI0022FD8703|nr:tetratricopeptide repeat protein [Aliamphritea hakodatensis]
MRTFTRLYRKIFKGGVCALLILGVAVLTGCAGNQQKSSAMTEEQSELYDGKPILAYLAAKQAKTPEEAVQRARSAMAENNLDKALYEYIRAYELDGKHTRALLEIGNIHYLRKNYKTAYVAFQKALSIDETLVSAHQGTGLILLREKQHSAAQEAFQKAVNYQQALTAEQDAAGENATVIRRTAGLALESYNGLGIIYDMQGKLDEAREHYHAGLKISGNSKVILNNLGYSHYMSAQWPEAEMYFSKALQTDNLYQPAWKNLGLVYARQERYLEALEALEQVMDTAQAYNDIGYICLLSKRYVEAADFFQKAITENPRYYKVAQQNLVKVKRLLKSGLTQNQEI